MTRPNGKPCNHCGGPRDSKSVYCTQCSHSCIACGVPRTWPVGALCGRCRRLRDMERTPDCIKCGETRDGSHPSYCRTCYREYDRTRAQTPEARLKDRAKGRRYSLRGYGLTVAEWDALLAAQDGRCAICLTDTPGGRGRFHVDHCHASGRVRGLLCHPCNVSLGHVKDSPDRLRRMISYLERNAE